MSGERVADQPPDDQVERFRAILRVVAQRAQSAGVTVEEYFAGIVAGTYPKVDAAELDAARRLN